MSEERWEEFDMDFMIFQQDLSRKLPSPQLRVICTFCGFEFSTAMNDLIQAPISKSTGPYPNSYMCQSCAHELSDRIESTIEDFTSTKRKNQFM